MLQIPTSSRITTPTPDLQSYQIWQTVAFKRVSLADSLPTQLGNPDLETFAHHVRELNVHLNLTSAEVGSKEAIKCFRLLQTILTTLSSQEVKKISLKIGIQETLFNPVPISSQALETLQEIYKPILSSIKSFSKLTSLDINVTSLLSPNEVDLADVISNLDLLEKFSAVSGGENKVSDMDALKLGVALASRPSLRVFSLTGLTSPRSSWSELNWKGTIEIIELKRCKYLENRSLIRFLGRFPSLQKLNLVGMSIKPMNQMMPGTFSKEFFCSLQQFSYTGIGPQLGIINQLSKSPKLEKMKLESEGPIDGTFFTLAFKNSFSKAGTLDVWPSLKVIFLQDLPSKHSDRKWIESNPSNKGISVNFFNSSYHPVMLFENEDIDSTVSDTIQLEYNLDSANTQASSMSKNVLMKDVRLPSSSAPIIQFVHQEEETDETFEPIESLSNYVHGKLGTEDELESSSSYEIRDGGLGLTENGTEEEFIEFSEKMVLQDDEDQQAWFGGDGTPRQGRKKKAPKKKKTKW
ncbi:hypothetical protein CROQUDRAFT_651488 [Cronartium quercuum f. sp. fusiforme G11]|uniref:Uncharacterized protein n=1 Tax=Cronartium quercuum f. sp. fusiforme G11 TaxID=708437 RepID=A0A9P6NXD6_9BASI|nr:hypothetical protein CROQUDRAFT_651488 [Cronartium quercuum f. sp. fusiforme G11]